MNCGTALCTTATAAAVFLVEPLLNCMLYGVEFVGFGLVSYY
jgi:hypothetical protein